VNTRLEVGLGYWGTSEKPRPGFAWQMVPQAANRPALLVGYGSEPMGNWRDDGAYLSLVKGFGPPHFIPPFEEGTRLTPGLGGKFAMVWGVVEHNGLLLLSDMQTGLWILRDLPR
jgi:hypothetical protein